MIELIENLDKVLPYILVAGWLSGLVLAFWILNGMRNKRGYSAHTIINFRQKLAAASKNGRRIRYSAHH